MNTTPAAALPAPESKYVASRDITEIAKLVRADVAAAVKAGVLPKGLKCSVRIERYSMGQSLHLTVKAAPGLVFVSTKRVRFDVETRGHEFTPMSRYSVDGQRVLDTLKAIVAAYNRDRSDIMVDYFDVNFYEHIGFASALESAQREEIAAAVKGSQVAA